MSKKNIPQTELPSYKPTALGKAILDVSKNDVSNEAWEKLYNTFLNSSFFMPVIATTDIKNGKATIDSELNQFLSIDKNGKTRSVLLFEKSSRFTSYLKNDAHLDKTSQKLVYAIKYDRGYDFLHSLPPKYFKEFNVMIDFGRKAYFILDSQTLLWLRKIAKAEKK